MRECRLHCPQNIFPLSLWSNWPNACWSWPETSSPNKLRKALAVPRCLNPRHGFKAQRSMLMFQRTELSRLPKRKDLERDGPYGGSLFPGAEKVTKKACSYVRPTRWGSGFLRSGIDPGAAPTVCFAAPPLAVFGCAKRSLRSHARINPSTQPSDVARESRSRAGELTLGLLSGEEHSVVGFGFVVDSPLIGTPPAQPSPEGEGADFWAFQNLSSTRDCTSA